MNCGYAQPKQINMDVKAIQDALQDKPYLCFIGNINNTGVMMDEWISSGTILASDGSVPVFELARVRKQVGFPHLSLSNVRIQRKSQNLSII